jgi:hypothetical protein
MKKLFIVLAVASLGFVACNNEASTETNTEDSIRIADSIRQDDSLKQAQAAQQMQDTMHHDSMPPKDTTKK